ncbi:hypothetical protein M231_02369 [Tremella mesenterica]|uniref:Uncharacterized protein n=1 Tax=Tremella mesenterica TaxID=5217 RepID=A0A4Q1BR12_TREME|nr:hypothetical protein M231_02369 [Tremella mesenterica]
MAPDRTNGTTTNQTHRAHGRGPQYQRPAGSSSTKMASHSGAKERQDPDADGEIFIGHFVKGAPELLASITLNIHKDINTYYVDTSVTVGPIGNSFWKPYKRFRRNCAKVLTNEMNSELQSGGFGTTMRELVESMTEELSSKPQLFRKSCQLQTIPVDTTTVAQRQVAIQICASESLHRTPLDTTNHTRNFGPDIELKVNLLQVTSTTPIPDFFSPRPFFPAVLKHQNTADHQNHHGNSSKGKQRTLIGHNYLNSPQMTLAINWRPASNIGSNPMGVQFNLSSREVLYPATALSPEQKLHHPEANVSPNSNNSALNSIRYNTSAKTLVAADADGVVVIYSLCSTSPQLNIDITPCIHLYDNTFSLTGLATMGHLGNSYWEPYHLFREECTRIITRSLTYALQSNFLGWDIPFLAKKVQKELESDPGLLYKSCQVEATSSDNATHTHRELMTQISLALNHPMQLRHYRRDLYLSCKNRGWTTVRLPARLGVDLTFQVPKLGVSETMPDHESTTAPSVSSSSAPYPEREDKDHTALESHTATEVRQHVSPTNNTMDIHNMGPLSISYPPSSSIQVFQYGMTDHGLAPSQVLLPIPPEGANVHVLGYPYTNEAVPTYANASNYMSSDPVSSTHGVVSGYTVWSQPIQQPGCQSAQHPVQQQGQLMVHQQVQPAFWQSGLYTAKPVYPHRPILFPSEGSGWSVPQPSSVSQLQHDVHLWPANLGTAARYSADYGHLGYQQPNEGSDQDLQLFTDNESAHQLAGP